MKGSLDLGSVSGIKIKVHWTFLLLIVWIVFEELKQGGTTEGVLFNVTFVITVFACVVLHELGHALSARRFGVTTKKITLLPIGGMASLDKIPESPKQELIVAIAGPLVNIIIAFLLYFLIPFEEYLHSGINNTFEVLNDFTWQNFVFYLFVVNIGLVLFNMIPAFPMDGGRVFRALLAMRMDRVKATQIASNIGQSFAVVFLLLGLLYSPILIFIALFIFLAAYGENQIVQHLSLLKGHTVGEAMILNITTFSPDDSIDKVVNEIISGTQNNFVVVEDNSVKGLLYHQDIINNSNKNVSVKEVMKTDFIAVNITDNLQKVYRLIQSQKKPFFPVLNNGKLAGVIDRINLNEYIMLQAKLDY